jgi:Tfp pilus assembly protein PilO
VEVVSGLAELRYCLRYRWARAGLIAAAIGMVALAGATAAWWPAQVEQDALEQQISAKRRALARAQHSEELARIYQRAEKDVASLEAKLRHGATQAQLVQSFARLARRHGVRIVSETYEEGRNAAAQTALSAELAVQGPYPALRDFLREIGSLPTWSEVHEARIESAPGAAVQKGRIRIVTYRLKSA